MAKDSNLVVFEKGRTLVIQERRGGVLVTLMQVTAGAITAVEREYFRANIIGRIKQAEADLILKYFYDMDIK